MLVPRRLTFSVLVLLFLFLFGAHYFKTKGQTDRNGIHEKHGMLLSDSILNRVKNDSNVHRRGVLKSYEFYIGVSLHHSSVI